MVNFLKNFCKYFFTFPNFMVLSLFHIGSESGKAGQLVSASIFFGLALTLLGLSYISETIISKMELQTKQLEKENLVLEKILKQIEENKL